MKNFTSQALLKKKISRTVFFAFALLLSSQFAQSQVRSYSLIYSENLKGGTTMFGNTLLHILKSNSVDLTKMNDNKANGNSSYGNDDENMQFVDIDGNTGNGSVTKNSSSADLILPAGTNTIKLARLYWGGRVKNSEYDLTKDANKKIKIRKGTTNAYTDVSALGIDKLAISNTTGYTEYQAYADITSYVTSNGGGTYSVGNVPLSVGSVSSGGNHGGWCIVVVYENAGVNYNSVRVYDGFQQVYSGGSSTTSTVSLTGLDVPSGALAAADAQMGVMSWEGDANINGDFLKINGNLFSNATNSSNNPWNGTITTNGVHVTTKSPNYTNQMGIDIDMFDVGSYGILPNDNSVKLQFGTETDQYYPGLFTFSIKMKDPTITLEKSVTDANNNHLAESGEVLTYTLKGANLGVGNANNIVVIDTLPNTVTYLPNSLKVISSPGVAAGSKTDASGDDVAEYIVNGSVKTVIFKVGTGATSAAGGSLAESETYEVQFQVKVNNPGSGNRVPSIMNIARVKSSSDANVIFTDDGTAIINPEAGPLPVTLARFDATLLNDSKVKLDWATSMEINCSKYIIERSFDGRVFSAGATIAGNGTTSLFHSYSSTDDIPSYAGSAVYYRLKQIDIDGKENLSKIISVKLKKDNQVVSVSPNPFTSYLNISMDWGKTEVITAKVINVQGKEVVSKTIQVNKGFNNVRIDDLSKLPPGNYFIQFISATERFTQKVTK